MAPTIGQTVHYVLTAEDAAGINLRRQAGFDTGFGMGIRANEHAEGQIVPLVVTRINGKANVNGQAILDGEGCAWMTSRPLGAGPGTWAFPPVDTVAAADVAPPAAQTGRPVVVPVAVAAAQNVPD